jgi:hypothetical protein
MTSTARAAPPRDYRRMAYRHRPGSVPAEHRKKVYLARNPAVQRHPEQEVFLQPLTRHQTWESSQEEEREWNEPTPPWGVYIVGERRVGGRPKGQTLGHRPHQWPLAPRGNPRAPSASALAGLASLVSGLCPFSLFPFLFIY